MFIGEGPNKDDETAGLPFMGANGTILRRVIAKLGLQDFYLTTLTACRSCTPYLDAQGQPSMRKNWKTKQMEVSYRDDPPTPLMVEACSARLYEQIYLVDPIVIVTLGAGAAKALIKKPINITSPDVRGQPFHISVPGAGTQTVRTEKKEAWIRTQRGEIQMPIEQSEVRYLCIPTYDPDYVMKKIADQSVGSPFNHFSSDVQKAVLIYERYMLELFGTLPTSLGAEAVSYSDEEILGPSQD